MCLERALFEQRLGSLLTFWGFRNRVSSRPASWDTGDTGPLGVAFFTLPDSSSSLSQVRFYWETPGCSQIPIYNTMGLTVFLTNVLWQDGAHQPRTTTEGSPKFTTTDSSTGKPTVTALPAGCLATDQTLTADADFNPPTASFVHPELSDPIAMMFQQWVYLGSRGTWD